MVKFDLEKIIKQSKDNFEEAWVETAQLLPQNTEINIKEKKGESHPFRNMIQKSRRILLYMGFDEIENKTILPDADVYKQYGPEAPMILDRAFYLAKMPRIEIGLSNEKINQAEIIIGKFDSDVLQNILRSYKKGEIEGDDFVEELVKGLKIKTEKATELLDSVFSEFKNLKPQPTDLTLRSHMTATWYHTLAALQDKSDFPLALFSVGPRYRNEQKEDKGHLRVHHSASLVVMDPEMSLEAGRKITEELLEKYGFDNVKFETKKATSKYYAKDQEQEVFVKHKGDWLEIADIGMYAVPSLANFGIKYPVFNAGLGIERLVMVLGDHTDIRELVYPQFSSKSSGFSDEEIAQSINYIQQPNTEKGKKIAEEIENIARKNKNEIAPCEFIAYEDDKILVKVTENEKGKKLMGPAGFNEIYVKDNNILSELEGKLEEPLFNYVKSISLGIAKDIEKSIEKNEEKGIFQVKMARSLEDINLTIPLSVRNYITGQHKRIKIGGPIFLTVEYHKKS